MVSETVYIGLGSNLDDPVAHVEHAFNDLNAIQGCRLLKRSSLYSSKPMGPQDQPGFINAVAKLGCDLTPMELLDELQRIERQHDRVREKRWGPRTLDLDILVFGNQVISKPELTIPHPGIGERAFVLQPLAELVSDLSIPGLGSVANQLANCASDSVIKQSGKNE